MNTWGSVDSNSGVNILSIYGLSHGIGIDEVLRLLDLREWLRTNFNMDSHE